MHNFAVASKRDEIPWWRTVAKPRLCYCRECQPYRRPSWAGTWTAEDIERGEREAARLRGLFREVTDGD